MFDPHWIEETAVDTAYAVALLIVVIAVLVGAGVAIGWWLCA